MVAVDVTNPGNFFACCGLLELANRLWPGAEGWFDERSDSAFLIAHHSDAAELPALVRKLVSCEITGLSESERGELTSLEAEKKQFTREIRELAPEKEARRKELGTESREGKILLGEPFRIQLDWWQSEKTDSGSPKTWAGRQEVQRVAKAAQASLGKHLDAESLLDIHTVLDGSVEPFYFDARRFTSSLTVGFSLDAQEVDAVAHPAVELLALVGLQRFRPQPTPENRIFKYWSWTCPLAPIAAASVASGAVAVPGRRGFSFPLRFRDNQKRYKAFGFATRT